MPIDAEVIQYGPWVRGVDYATPTEDLDGQTAYAMQNMRVGNAGQLETRGGYTKYIASAISGTPTIQGLGQHDFDASTTRVWTIAGTQFFEDVSGTWTDRSAAITITAGDDNTWQATDVGGVLFATNTSGTDVQIKWSAAGGNIANATVSARFTKAKWCAYWDTRLWYGNENTNSDYVWFSDLATPETIGATSFHQVDAPVTGLAPLRNMLAIHSERGIWGLFPTSTAGVYTQQKRADIGTVGGRSIVVNSLGTMFFVRNDGIYAWQIDTAVEQETSGVPVKISGALDGARYWDSINTSRLPYVHAVDYPLRFEVWFFLPHGSGQTDMNHVMLYNYRRNIWYGPYLNFTRNTSALIDDKPHAGGYDDGLVYTHNDGTDDAGTAIDAWVETAAPPAINAAADVRWLYARHHFDVKGAYDVTVTQTAPGIVAKTSTFNQGGTGDAIGTTFIIGSSAIFADSNRMQFADTDLHGYHPSTQLKYSNANANEPFSLRRTELMFRSMGLTRRESPGVE